MIIPHNQLSPEAIDNLAKDFTSRDGTDQGDETPEAVKVERVKKALDAGQAFIVFDVEFQQCVLVSRGEVPKEDLQQFEALTMASDN